MVSMKKSAANHLQKMVTGAAKQVKPNGRDEKSESQEQGGLPRNVAEKILHLIETQGKTLQNVPIDYIDLNENIRSRYDKAGLETLANSIKNDGLIQAPTLCLKKDDDGYKLVCKNGHRRVLAAKMLGWKKIECFVVQFETAVSELYVTLNANLQENVFYLDIAKAYQEAADLGESDKSIAERVGVSDRTVGWYRRLCTMSPACIQLVRDNPEFFNATWAILLSRKGPLPAADVLENWMRLMLKAGRTWIDPPSERPLSSNHQNQLEGRSVKVAEARATLSSWLKGQEGKDTAQIAAKVMQLLVLAGYLTEKNAKMLLEATAPLAKNRVSGDVSARLKGG